MLEPTFATTIPGASTNEACFKSGHNQLKMSIDAEGGTFFCTID
jgi:hypothetical protein